jgi:hypothetical protein
MLDASKKRHQAYLEKGEIEWANAEIREGSRICDRLGKNVVLEFMNTANEVRELKELVQSNIIKCPDCKKSFLSVHGLNSHRGKKHKVNEKI